MVGEASMAGPLLTMAWPHDRCNAVSDDRKMLAMSEKTSQELLRKARATVRLGWVSAVLIAVILVFELIFLAATPIDVLATKWGSPTDLVGLRWVDEALAISLSAVASAIGGILDWLVTEIPKAITWPIVALIALLAILRSQRALAWLLPVFGRFQSLKLGTFEVQLSEEGAKQLSLSAQEAFAQYRAKADKEFERQIRLTHLRDRLEQVVQATEIPDPSGTSRRLLSIPEFRCTIHVADILFTDNLYQLVDYYPRTQGRTAGRRFSARYGIIGQAWRLNEHQGRGDARAQSERELVEHWGMTREEAEAMSRHRPSYICVVLRDQGTIRLGVLFMDAKDKFAFGDDAQAMALAGEIEKLCNQQALTDALASVVKELGKYDASVQIQG